MAVVRVLSAIVAAATYVWAQTGAQQATVTPGDGSLLVTWNIPNADSSIASFEVHAQPVATMLSPSQNFLTSPNTTINELDGTVVDTSFVTVRAGNCVNLDNAQIPPATPANCNNATTPITAANTWFQGNGVLAGVLRPFHGLSFTTGLMGSASGYLWNNVPSASIVGAPATENAIYATSLAFNNYAVTMSPAQAGIMVHDFDPQGVFRPLITWNFQHAQQGQNNENKLFIRYLSQGGNEWYTHDVLVNLPSAPVQMAIERNAAEKKWRLFAALPLWQSGRWWYSTLPFSSFVPWQNTWDIYDHMLPLNMQPNATIALYGANSGPTQRSAIFERVTISRRSAYDLFLRNITFWETLNRDTGMCHMERTVATTGLSYSTARTQYRHRISGLFNAQPYTVRIVSVGTAGGRVNVDVSGVFAPTVAWPALPNSPGSVPALFLDARNAPPGRLRIWRDSSGNGRHFSQYIEAQAVISEGLSDTFPVGRIQGTSARWEMTQIDREDPGLDLTNLPNGMSVFTVYKLITTSQTINWRLISRTRFEFHTNGAMETDNMRPLSDDPGWEVWGHTSGDVSVVNPPPYGPGMRVIVSKNPGSTIQAPNINQVGIRYGVGQQQSWLFSHPDFNNPVIYNYNFYRTPAAWGTVTLNGMPVPTNTWILDGCRGVNRGVPPYVVMPFPAPVQGAPNAPDQCMYPDIAAGLVTQPATTITSTTSSPNGPGRWSPGLGSNVAQSIPPAFFRPNNNLNPLQNATGSGNAIQASSGILKLSDSNAYHGTGWPYQQTHNFWGDIYGILIYSGAITSRADRQRVQEWMLDRYAQGCRIINGPYLSNNPQAPLPPSVCAPGNLIPQGVACTVALNQYQCGTHTPPAGAVITKTRIGGAVPFTEALTCTQGNIRSKGFWCGHQCTVILPPRNVASCRHVYLEEFFNQAPTTTVSSLMQWDVVPALPPARVDTVWSFTGSAVRGELPYAGTNPCLTVPDSMFNPNRPAWADTFWVVTASAGTVVYSMDVSLEDNGARAGMAFRVGTTTGFTQTTYYYRLVFTAGVAGAALEFVQRNINTNTVRSLGTLLAPTFVPLPNVRYSVSVTATNPSPTTNGFIITVTFGSTTVELYRVTSDAPGFTQALFGWSGAYLANGAATFDNMVVSGSCRSGNIDGNCQPWEGSRCEYACPAGMVPLGATVRACGADSLTPTGASLSCSPPPPVPGQTQYNFTISEDAAPGTAIGSVLVTVPQANTSLDGVVIYSIRNNRQPVLQVGGALASRRTPVPGQFYEEVFDITLCGGAISLNLAGALNALYLRDIFGPVTVGSVNGGLLPLVVRAELAVDSSVFTEMQVGIAVLNARNRPAFWTGINIVDRMTRLVAENIALGSLVGTVSAVPGEPDQIVSHTLIGGNIGNMFTLNNATGQLTLTSGTLDFEAPDKTGGAIPNVFNLLILARDVQFPALQSMVTVDVTVLNRNDPPFVPLQQMEMVEDRARTIDVQERNGAWTFNLIGFIADSQDDDRSQLTYRIVSVRNGLTGALMTNPFRLNATSGQISLMTALTLPPGRRTTVADGRNVRIWYNLSMEATDESVRDANGDSFAAVTTSFNTRIYITPNTTFDADPIVTNVAISTPGAPRTTLDTAGGDYLTITGTGFNGVINSQTFSGISPPNVVTVTLTPQVINPITSPRRVVNVTECLIQDDNTIVCGRSQVAGSGVQAGYGTNLAVAVAWGADMQAMPIRGGGALLLSYTAPTLDDVDITATTRPSNPVTWPNGASKRARLDSLSTEGTQAIALRVSNAGPAGTPISVRYETFDGFTRVYPATVASFTPAAGRGAQATLIINVAPGVGRELRVRVTIGDQITQEFVDVATSNGMYVSYGAPSIDSIALAAGTNGTLTTFRTINGGTPCCGPTTPPTQSFVITGRNFGRMTDPFIVNLRWQPASIRVENVPSAYNVVTRPACRKVIAAEAHTVITCDMPDGVGQGWEAMVEVGAQPGPYNTNPLFRLGYAAPIVTTYWGPGSQRPETTGGQNIWIGGQNLGPDVMRSFHTEPAVPVATPYSVVFRAVGAPVDATPTFVMRNCRGLPRGDWGIGTQLTCQLPEGYGTNWEIHVIVGGQLATGQPSWMRINYAAPIITSLSRSATVTNSQPDIFVTPGNEVVYVDGLNFGPLSPTNPPNPWASLTVNYRMTLDTVRNVFNELITGSTLGTRTYVPTNCIMTRAHTQLECRMASGAGKSHSWTVVVAGQTSTQPALGYRPPVITGLSITPTPGVNLPATDVTTDGNVTLQISGNNFGSTGVGNCVNLPPTVWWPRIQTSQRWSCAHLIQSVTYGPSGTEFTARFVHWVNHNTIMMLLPPGYGQNFRVMVRIAEQNSVVSTVSFSYAAPVITSLSPSNGPAAAEANGFPITITGRNFALADPTAEQSVIVGNAGDSSEKAPLPTFDARILPNGDHQLKFYLPPGLLPDRIVRVVVHPRGRPSGSPRVESDPMASPLDSRNVPASIFDYDAPQIDAIVVSGFPLGNRPAETFALGAFPQFSSSQLQTLFMLTLLGRNFGQSQQTLRDGILRDVMFLPCAAQDDPISPGPCRSARVYASGGQASAAVWTWADGRIVLFTPDDEGLLQIRQQGSSRTGTPLQVLSPTRIYLQRSPEVTDIQGPTTLRTSGGEMLTIKVKNLNGLSPVEGVGRLLVVMQVLNRPDGSIMNRTCQIVDAGGNPYTSYSAMYSSIVGNVINSAPAGADPSSLEFTIRFLTPAGEGRDRAIIVVRDEDASDTEKRISYARPTVDRWEVVTVDRTGAPLTLRGNFPVDRNMIVPTLPGELRLFGTNFGLCPRFTMATGIGAVVGAGGADCTAVNSLAAVTGTNSHTYLSFSTVAGQGSGHDMFPATGYSFVLTVGGQDFTYTAGAQAFSRINLRYLTPEITFITPEGSTAGGTPIQIRGYHLGATAAGMAIRIGNQACTSPQFTPGPANALQTVTCTLAEGSGIGQPVEFSTAGYVCVQAPSSAQCTVNTPNAFKYSAPVIREMYLGGTGNLSEVLGPDAMAYSYFLTGNSSFTNVAAPAWLHTVPTRATPGVDSYSAVLSQVNERGVSLLGPAGFPVNIPTSGGRLLAIIGENFGKLDFAKHCLFFAWAGRSMDTSNFACNNANSFLGEEEVPSLAILHWSHSIILLVSPPGYGGRDLVPWINGQGMPWLSQGAAVHFNRPSIASLDPPNGDTSGNEPITAFGADFGFLPTTVTGNAALNAYPTTMPLYLTMARPPMSAFVINFGRRCITNHRTLDNQVPADLQRCAPPREIEDAFRANFRQTHNEVVFRTLKGIGTNRTVTFMVWDRNTTTGLAYNLTSAPIMFNYRPPTIKSVLPRPVRMNGDRDARYDVEMPGDNLGSPPDSAELLRDPLSAWSEDELRLEINVAGTVCAEPSRLVTPGRVRDSVELRCTLPSMTVGFKNITYTVAGQTNFNADRAVGANPYPQDAVFMACRAEFFGKPGEFCAPCPEGAVCRGFDNRQVVIGTDNRTDAFLLGGIHSYPRPIAGFFNLNSTDLIVERLKREGRVGAMDSQYDIACPPAVKDRYLGRDVCIVACEPPEACLTDNYCAEGYRSLPPQFRCAFCEVGFYKRNNECVKCPNSPWALVIGFLALVLFGAAAAYILNKKKINIAFIAIFVDWAQVIAIFSASRVAWPPIVKELFHILSAFNLNIEIVAPECIVPDLQFRQKWSFIMALPISLTAFFMLITVFQVVYRRYIKGKKVSFANQGSSFASMTLLLMYVLYIYLTRNILDVFNCQPREPDEGKLYLTVGSGEECYVPGGTQATLAPAAVIAAIFYIAGYPACLAVLLYRNFDLAIEDQLLRAKGQGDDKLTNPRGYVLRKRFSRVYYQFKPESVFWILAIILRKFCLAATYILFNRNASFQLASALLVIFVAYAAQMKYQPYMGPGDYEAALKSFEAKAIQGDAKAVQIWTKIRSVESRGRKKVYKNLMSVNGKVDARALLGLLRGWLFAYNTVEEILLFSAGTVALMGIMYASLNPKSTNFNDARDSVTWVIVAAIILTIIYFVTVTLTEVYILYTEDIRKKQMEAKNKMRAGKRGGKSLEEDDMKAKDKEAAAAMANATGEMNVGMVNSSYNPMFENSSSTAGLKEVVEATDDVPSGDLWRVFRQGYQELREDLEKLSKEVAEVRVRRQKMEEAAAMLEAATGKKLDLPVITDANGEKYKAGRRKQEFGPLGSEEGGSTNSPLNAFKRTPNMGGASPSVGAKSLKSLGSPSLRSLRK